MIKIYKLSRRDIHEFNYSCSHLSNPYIGYTIQEYVKMFSNSPFVKVIPVIISLYKELGALNNDGPKCFIYWDQRSADTKSRAWNKFDLAVNTWVCDNRSKSGIMFKQPIYYRSKNYLDTYVDYQYDTDSPIGQYIEKNLLVNQPRTHALF